MRAPRYTALAVVVVFLAVPALLSAQSIWVGGMGTFPFGEYGDEDQTAAETGWLGFAGLGFPLSDDGRLSLGGEVFYGQNDHSDGDEKTNPYGVMAIISYGFADADEAGLYVGGGLGLLVHKYTDNATPDNSDSSSHFGYQGFAGYGLPLGDSLGLFLEGRVMGATETTFFGLGAGLNIGVG